MKKNKKLFWILLLSALLLVLFLSNRPAPADIPAPAETEALTLIGTAPAQPPAATEAPAGTEAPAETTAPAPTETPAQLPDEDGVYTTAEDVALYLHTYGHLPSNFITKTKARSAGWDGGSLEDVLPGMCIGGGGFANREGLLPDAPGRSWRECDINTLGKASRGAERLVYSSDGLIYYTGDHYESFQLLYGEP